MKKRGWMNCPATNSTAAHTTLFRPAYISSSRTRLVVKMTFHAMNFHTSPRGLMVARNRLRAVVLYHVASVPFTLPAQPKHLG